MPFDAGSITGTLEFDTNPFANAMQGAVGIAASSAASIVGSFGAIKTAATALMANPLIAAAAAVVLALKGIYEVATFVSRAVGDVAAEGDKLGEMAANVGVSVKALSGLGLVAEQAGASTNAVADGYKMLGRNVAEAGEAAAKGNFKGIAGDFQQLGIAVTDASGNLRPVESVMMDVADAIASLPAGAARTDAAMKLLGRSGTELVGTLSQGSKAINDQIQVFDSYGAVISDSAAKSAGVWSDAMDEIGTFWQGLKREMAEPIIDALRPLLEGLVAWLRQNGPFVVSVVGEVTRTVISMIGAVTAFVQGLIDKLYELISLIPGMQIASQFVGASQESSAPILRYGPLRTGGAAPASMPIAAVVPTGGPITSANMFAPPAVAQASVRESSQLTREMQTLGDAMRDSGDVFRDFADRAVGMIVSAQSATQTGGAQRSESGATRIDNLHLHTPPFDTNEASSQIAAKIQPALRETAARQRMQFEGAAKAANVARGL